MSKRRYLRLLVPVVAAAVLAMLPCRSARATTYTVTSTADGHDSNLGDGICSTGIGDCTLRAAIEQASPSDTINITSSLSGTTITVGSTLAITRNLTINGSGVTVSGGNSVAVFLNDATLTLNSLTITQGSGTGGAAIQNTGTLTLNHCTVAGNNSPSGGGGIYSLPSSSLTVLNSTFTGNVAVTSAGAILNSGTAILANSTFTGNTAASGGCIRNGGTITILNCTFSGNSASTSGADIYNDTYGTLNIANTIMANTPSGQNCVNLGTIGTNTRNLVESGTGCGTPALTADPLLAALAANGGPTQTMALQAGSPALDAGDDTVCAASPVSNLDQRGLPRPVNAHCDIGAYESQVDLAPAVVSINRAGSDPTSLDAIAFLVTFSESVTGVDASDFTLATTGVTGAAVSGVSGSGSSYTVSVSTGSGNGTIRLDLVDDDSIVDGAANPLGGTGSGNGNFSSGQTYTVTRACVDADGDGYGEYCAAGTDCNDADPFYSDVCPACAATVIPFSLGRFLGDKVGTRTLLVIGERGADFDSDTQVTWETSAIAYVRHHVLFKRFMLMRVTIDGTAITTGNYRVLVGKCEGVLRVVR